MTKRFTTQEVINMACERWDQGFDRWQIKAFLQSLLDSNEAEFDIERVFDLVVG